MKGEFGMNAFDNVQQIEFEEFRAVLDEPVYIVPNDMDYFPKWEVVDCICKYGTETEIAFKSGMHMKEEEFKDFKVYRLNFKLD